VRLLRERGSEAKNAARKKGTADLSARLDFLSRVAASVEFSPVGTAELSLPVERSGQICGSFFQTGTSAWLNPGWAILQVCGYWWWKTRCGWRKM
jgi:hypothetical protein